MNELRLCASLVCMHPHLHDTLHMSASLFLVRPAQVLLRNPADGGRALVHATSWWNAAAASSNLRDPSQPIWVSLTQAHKELYREIQTVQLGGSAALEQHFGEARMTVRGPAHS